jgi:hypothetical protein
MRLCRVGYNSVFNGKEFGLVWKTEEENVQFVFFLFVHPAAYGV